MKRLLSLLLALLMLFSFTACNVDQETVDLALDVAEALLEEAAEAEEPAAAPMAPEELEEKPEPEEPSYVEDEPVSEPPPAEEAPAPEEETPAIDQFGSYTTRDDVALYLYTYGCLPQNFMTKNEARKLGWEGGGLDPYAEGMCIGGDRFGNYEGLLPEKDGRTYQECDIDTLHSTSRGPKRIVFSNDGLIYYTDDHYESFTLLYGEEEP